MVCYILLTENVWLIDLHTLYVKTLVMKKEEKKNTHTKYLKNNNERRKNMKLQEAIDWVDGTLDTYQTIQEDELVNDGTIKNNIKKVDKAWSLIRHTLRTIEK